jgi:RNA-binding protein
MPSQERQEQRRLTAIAHKLQPVLTVAGKGLSEGVLAELERALSDHELIKVKLAVGDRDTRDALVQEMATHSGAKIVQQIGNTAVLLRRAQQPDPKLSNLIRRV